MTAHGFENPKGRRRLLRHCALPERPLKGRVPARLRLDRALGREQATLLVRALSGDHGLVRRGRRRRRVRSSP
jgi:hypothetical protein